MDTLTKKSEPATATAVRLVTQRPDGQREVRELTSDGGVLVGSAQSCGFRLEGGNVAPLHCWFHVKEGEVWVQDWYSGAGTYVGGERIEEETLVVPGTVVQVGDYSIEVEPGGVEAAPSDLDVADHRDADLPPESTDASPDPEGTAGSSRSALDSRLSALIEKTRAARPRSTSMESTETPAAKSPADPTSADADSQKRGQAPFHTDSMHQQDPESREMGPDPFSAPANQDTPASDAPREAQPDSRGEVQHADAGELERLRSELGRAAEETAGLRRENSRLRARAARSSSASDEAGDPFDQEMLELLKEEVSQLQSELAERDAQLAQLTAGSQSVAAPSAGDVDPSETAALVERLEQLLEELERSDERVAELQELLRMADEASQAEQEERRQLEAWVNDIEGRISQREEHWQAEKQVLERRVEELAEERDRAERELEQIAVGDSPAAHESLVEDLRKQLDELQRRLEETGRENEGLRRQLQEAQSSGGGVPQEEVDRILRDERMAMARERAELARSRAELARLQSQLGDASSGSNSNNDVNQRLRVLRQHLREIHAEEQEQREQQPAGLAGRLSRLWKRLDE